MNKNITLDTLFNGIIVLYGQSGAGKGELQKRLEEYGSENGVRVIYLASGDMFRAITAKIREYKAEDRLTELSTSELAVADAMEAGKQIPTLETIMQPLIDAFSEYITARLKGEKVIVIMDGVLRNGESMHEGQIVPSQVLQVSEAFARAGRKVVTKHPGLVQTALAKHELDLNTARQFALHADIPLMNVSETGFVGEVATALRSQANHAIVDVTREDAEVLMRLRSVKTLENQTIPALGKILGDDNIVLADLKKLLLIQTGRFALTPDGIKLLDSSVPPNTFRPFDMDPEFVAVIDTEVNRICMNILLNLGEIETDDKKSLVAQAFEAISKKTEVEPSDLPRVDDILLSTRVKRIGEYTDKVGPKIIEGELGLKIVTDANSPKVGLDFTNSHTNPNRAWIITNGPSRGITYEMLLKQADAVAPEIFSRATGTSVEGSFGGKELK